MSNRNTTHISIDDGIIRIELCRRDKVAALVGDRSIAVAAVTGVTVVDDPLQSTPGLRSPGLGIPGVAKVGTWRGDGRRTLVVVRRGQRAVRIDAPGRRFDAYLIGVDDPETVADRIQASRR